MDLDSIEFVEGTPRVKIKPTTECGTFVVHPDGPKRMSGRLIVMYDVRTPDALAAELGDKEALQNYIRPVDPLNGVFRYVGSCALIDDIGAERWFVDSNVFEEGFHAH